MLAATPGRQGPGSTRPPDPPTTPQRPHPQRPHLAAHGIKPRRDLIISTQRDQAGWHNGPPAAAAGASVAANTIRLRRRQRLVRVGAAEHGRQAAAERAGASPRAWLPGGADGAGPRPYKARPSAAEQQRLATAAAQGDEWAAAELVDANRRLVHYMAEKFVGRGLAREDLVAEGLLALQRAAQRWRPGAATFGTFAAAAMYNAMCKALHTQTQDIRLPNHHWADLMAVRRAMGELAAEQQGPPRAAAVAKRCGMTLPHTARLLRSLSSSRAAEVWAAADSGDPTQPGVPLESWDNEGDETVDAQIKAAEGQLLMQAQVHLGLARLEPHLARLVVLRHGMDGAQQQRRTWREIGECMGMSGSWAASNYKVAARRLRVYMGAQAPRTAERARGVSAGGSRTRRARARPLALPAGSAQVTGAPSQTDPLDTLADALDSLRPVEQLAMALRHGWLDGDSALQTFAAVAARMKRTTSGARDAYNRAASVLEARLEALGHPPVDLGRLSFSPRQREAWRRQLAALPAKAPRQRNPARAAAQQGAPLPAAAAAATPAPGAGFVASSPPAGMPANAAVAAPAGWRTLGPPQQLPSGAALAH